MQNIYSYHIEGAGECTVLFWIVGFCITFHVKNIRSSFLWIKLIHNISKVTGFALLISLKSNFRIKKKVGTELDPCARALNGKYKR